MPELWSFKQWRMIMSGGESTTAPKDDEEQAARMGVDIGILQLLGWHNVVNESMPAEYRARYETVMPRQPLCAAARYANVAFQWWYGRSSACVKASQLQQLDRIFYVMGGNAAGKSWLCHHIRDVMDSDVAVWQRMEWRDSDSDPDTEAGRAYAAEACASISACVKAGADVLVGTWSAVTLCKAAKAAKIALTTVYYEPGVSVRRARMAERGWDADKIEWHVQRSERLKRQCRHVISAEYGGPGEVAGAVARWRGQ